MSKWSGTQGVGLQGLGWLVSCGARLEHLFPAPRSWDCLHGRVPPLSCALAFSLSLSLCASLSGLCTGRLGWLLDPAPCTLVAVVEGGRVSRPCSRRRARPPVVASRPPPSPRRVRRRPPPCPDGLNPCCFAFGARDAETRRSPSRYDLTQLSLSLSALSRTSLLVTRQTRAH